MYLVEMRTTHVLVDSTHLLGMPIRNLCTCDTVWLCVHTLHTSPLKTCNTYIIDYTSTWRTLINYSCYIVTNHNR